MLLLVQANEWRQVSCKFARSSISPERILRCRTLNKENINFWEEDITSENQECVTVIEDIFGTRTREILEHGKSWKAFQMKTGYGYAAKKLIKRSKCESCKILLKAGDVDITNVHNYIFFLVVDYSCYQSHLLILCVVTLLLWISLSHILWLYLYLSKHQQPMSCVVMDQNLILPESTIQTGDLTLLPKLL